MHTVVNGRSSHLGDSECSFAFMFDFFVLQNVLDFFPIGKASSWSLTGSGVMHRVHGISMGEARAGIAAITSRTLEASGEETPKCVSHRLLQLSTRRPYEESRNL